ncbi:hypothetical protein DD563_02790 [Pelagicola sp. LXJ1103]|nr:hypothetical protein DD563_02790 [Pelagicola sp. LXJ1103]
MKPQISEFSYGFALTNELVSWTSIATAPIFPSLIEEGKAGGGYDVKLDLPGVPLFLQFKRSHCMTRRSAREYKLVTAAGGALRVPYYRFPITESDLSDQHEMLLELDDGTHFVFYAAPRFHTRDEINSAWSASEVARKSIFLAPQQIGSLDSNAHTVAFDHSNAWVCSTPKRLSALTSNELHDKILATLDHESLPAEKRIDTLIEEMRGAEERGRRKAQERRSRDAQERLGELPDMLSKRLVVEQIDTVDGVDGQASSLPDASSGRPETREPKPLKEHEAKLRAAADLAARVFDAQLLIVQKSDET